jgi:predicted NBD/HSP70 family sugar kinase
MGHRGCIAVDIGASRIRVGLAGHQPSYVGWLRDPEVSMIIRHVARGVQQAREHHGARGLDVIAVGCPGVISEGVIERVLYLPLTGVNLRQRLRDALCCEVVVVNDVDAQAVGDPGFESGRSYFVTSIGSSVGGAFVYEGELVVGRTHSIAEIGHTPCGGLGRRCQCGGTDCLDTYMGGIALERALGAKWWRRTHTANHAFAYAGIALSRAVRGAAVLLDLDYLVALGHLVGQVAVWDSFLAEHAGLGSELPVSASRDTWPHAARGLERLGTAATT